MFKTRQLIVMAIVFVLAGLPLLAMGAEKKADTVKATHWKLHLETTDDSPLAKGAREFSRLVKEGTGGKYLIDVYPNAQLSSGNQVKALEMLITGSIEFVWQSGLIQSSIEPKLGALSLPWLWKDFDTIDKTLEGPVGDKMFDLLKGKGIIGLAWGENGFRELTNNTRIITKPEDMQNVKFRVIGNRMLFGIFKKLGSNPTSMNFGELFTGLQQGTVDGQENPILSVTVPSRFYEVQKYMTIWNYAYDAFLLEVNAKLWNSLDNQSKKIIKDAALKAGKFQRKLTRDGTEDAIKMMEGKGLKVTRLTPEQIKVFKERVKSVYDEWVPQYGEDLVKQLQDANE